MPLPKGDVHKKKEVIQDVTLHDLDVANARPQVSMSSTRLSANSWQQSILLQTMWLFWGRE